MTGLQERVKLLQEELDGANPRRGYVNRILESLEQSASLTRQLLAASRTQTGKRAPLDPPRAYSTVSKDGGRTWSAAIKLPPGILGPIRAKPIEISPGVMLAGSSTEDDGWVAHMEKFGGPWDAQGLASAAAWQKSGPLNAKDEFGAIQPAILVHSKTELQILLRSRQRVIAEAWSKDGGVSWGRMTATSLPNPSAGIDALRLADGRFLLVYNPSPTSRAKLALAVSADGKAWRQVTLLEDEDKGEFSYPAMIQSRDGQVHITYTWRREKIKHVAIDPKTIGK
jgi:hypothetical protein